MSSAVPTAWQLECTLALSLAVLLVLLTLVIDSRLAILVLVLARLLARAEAGAGAGAVAAVVAAAATMFAFAAMLLCSAVFLLLRADGSWPRRLSNLVRRHWLLASIFFRLPADFS